MDEGIESEGENMDGPVFAAKCEEGRCGVGCDGPDGPALRGYNSLCKMMSGAPGCQTEFALTRIVPFSRSHSARSLPPPVLNRRRSEREGVSSEDTKSGSRMVNANESTFDA